MATPERLLISAIIRNKTKKVLNDKGFNSDNMVRCKDEMNFILTARNIPSKKAFKSKFPRFNILNVPESDMELLVDQCKTNKVKTDLTKSMLDASHKLNAGENPDVVLQHHIKSLRSVDLQFSDVKDINIMENMDTYMLNYAEKFEQMDSGKYFGIPYGFDYLDGVTGGMQPQELITIVARTGIGKTWVLCKFCSNAALAGYKAVYFSLEMDWQSITNRLFTIISWEISQDKFNNDGKKAKKRKGKIADILYNMDLNLGKIPTKKVGRIVKEIHQRIGESIIVPDIPGTFGVATSGQKIELLEPDVAFFDYFGQQSFGSGNRGASEGWQQAADASKLAKRIARTYNIPYVMGAQLNRAGANTKKPSLDQISLTDSVGQDSDKVFILIPLENRNDKLHMVAEKFRAGEGNFRLVLDWDPNMGKVEQNNVIKGE